MKNKQSLALLIAGLLMTACSASPAASSTPTPETTPEPTASAEPSWEVIEKVPLDFLKKAYSGLHDLDLDLAVRKVGEV